MTSWPVIKSGTVAVILGTCFSLVSTENESRRVEKNQASRPPIIKKPPASFDNAIIIDSRAAVFYNPDSLQMEKIRSVNDERDYINITHDCYFQMQNARNVIRKYWPKIRIVEVVRGRFLVFVKKDGSKITIDLNDKNNICGLFLFAPDKDPELIDMPNVDSFLGFYFGK